ncbi:MAG TPA: enoyl-CoA hydratase-related protein [Candidatus Thermoplasmatota archaeon]|nr:enoyl-CoA hydratase-related protein [Candidatus Thermoplasmatota archaeon]
MTMAKQELTTEFVKVKVDNKIAVVTLDHAPVNALSPAVLREIKLVFDQLSANDEVRAIVLTGAGQHAFCAGADLKAFSGVGPDKALEIVQAGHDAFNAIEDCRKPVIAAVNNLALGGGCELAMSADIRVSSDRARFGQPEVWIGLIPAWGGSTRLPKIVGAAKAKELIFTGQMINAQEAQRIGLVNKIVPDGEEVRAAIDIARMILHKAAPLAVQEAKKAINDNLRAPDRATALKNEREAAGRLVQTADLVEGITAFIEKRSPEFKGQ